MTTDELKALIQSDAEVKRLAELGHDDASAMRCRQIAPREVTSVKVTELTVLNLYADPKDADAVLRKIETVASTNSVVKRVLKWLQPGAPGVDVGDQRVRQLLVAPTTAGGVGLTAAQAAPLLAAAETEPSISGADVASCGLYKGQN